MSEDVLLKWSEEPLKHRFSCLTDKFIKNIDDITARKSKELMEI